MDIICTALQFAAKMHHNQIRKNGDLYIEHPRKVYRILKNLKVSSSSDVYVSALLHDVCEDTNLSPSMLKNEFDNGVCLRVYFLSKEPKIYFNGNQEYRLQNYLEKLRHGALIYPDIILIKLADQIDNLESLCVFPKRKQQEQIAELKIYFQFYHDIFSCIPQKYIRSFQELAYRLIKDVEEAQIRLNL